MPLTFHREEASASRNAPFGFLGHAGIREMQGFLDAKRATDICITLCIKGFLHSRWSVEMTGFLGGVEIQVWDYRQNRSSSLSAVYRDDGTSVHGFRPLRQRVSKVAARFLAEASRAAGGFSI